MNARVWIQPAALAVAIVLGGMASGGFAQPSPSPGGADENHSAHHPKAAEAPAAPAQTGETPTGVMGQDHQGGMMMGRDMKEMMSMMRDMMNMMMSAQGGMMASNVEGRIATLKIALKITDAQSSINERYASAHDVVGHGWNTVGTAGISGGDAVGPSDLGEIAQGSIAAALCLFQRRAEKDRRRHDDRTNGHDVTGTCA